MKKNNKLIKNRNEIHPSQKKGKFQNAKVFHAFLFTKGILLQ
jgi:hypothetical protein